MPDKDPFTFARSGLAAGADEEIVAMFRRWAADERRVASARDWTDDEIDAAVDDCYAQCFAILRHPAEGAVGLAIKSFIVLHTRYGGDGYAGSILAATAWDEERIGYASTRAELAMADDLTRFVPELVPLLDPALAVGRRALAAHEESASEPETIAEAGHPAPAPLSGRERLFLAAWHQCDPAVRDDVDIVLSLPAGARSAVLRVYRRLMDQAPPIAAE